MMGIAPRSELRFAALPYTLLLCALLMALWHLVRVRGASRRASMFERLGYYRQVRTAEPVIAHAVLVADAPPSR
jgi:hypothetical protein